jgi:hypothetical protein
MRCGRRRRNRKEGKKEGGGARVRATFSGAVRQQRLQQNNVKIKARERIITMHGDKNA